MNIAKTANDITNLYGLIENQNLTNEQRLQKIKEIIVDTYKKGYDSGKKYAKVQLIKAIEAEIL